MKKILSGLFVCFTLISLCACSSDEQTECSNENIQFSENNNLLTVENIINTDSNSILTIPEEVDGKKVIGINLKGSSEFQLDTLNIPKTINNINLTNFYGCINKITIDKDNKYYDSRDFSNTINDTNLNKLIYIGKFGIIPNSISIIGDDALGKCFTNKIYIPSSVSRIEGKSNFLKYTSQIIVNKNNTVFNSNLDCNAIIESKSKTMVAACKNSFIPEGVVSLNSNLLDGYEMTNIHIPSTVTDIKDDTFINCGYFENITVSENNPIYDSRENCNAINDKTENKILYTGKNSIIHPTIREITATAFKDSLIESIRIPQSVYKIDEKSFENCSKLNELSVENDNPVFYTPDDSNAILRKSDNYMIKGCNNTIFPEETEGIENYAFNKSYIYRFNIPANTKEIKTYAFYHCYNLENISVNENNQVYSSPNDCKAIIKTDEQKLILGCKNTKFIDSLKIIGENAIYKLDSTEVILPYGLEKIEKNALRIDPCFDKLTSVFIPTTVETIGINGISSSIYLNIYISSNKRLTNWDNYCFTGKIKTFYRGNWPSDIKNPYL